MLQTTINIVQEATTLLMQFYDGKNDIGEKSGQEIVTSADLAVDAFLQTQLKKHFSEDQILSEERADEVEDYTGRVWIIDPLDGTKQFTEKKPYFSINVACCFDGIPILGVVSAPMEKNIYYAEKGKGSFVLNQDTEQQNNVSSVDILEDARFVTFLQDDKAREFDTIVNSFQVKQRMPISNFGVLHIAAGDAEFYMHASGNIKKWDTCAAQVILEEAGGKVSDLDGNMLDYTQESFRWERSVVMSNGVLHEEILDKVKLYLGE